MRRHATAFRRGLGCGYLRLSCDWAAGAATRADLNDAIFNELCLGIFEPETTDLFVRAIDDLRRAGADCVILGCTEIPLIISEANSPLPVLDSTRLLASYAVREAIKEKPLSVEHGWLHRA